MRFWLDYPGVNCRQCGDNLKTDGIEPECDGCPVKDWSQITWQALGLYNQACQNRELDAAWFETALNDALIPVYKRALYRRLVTAIHHEVTRYHVDPQRQRQSRD